MKKKKTETEHKPRRNGHSVALKVTAKASSDRLLHGGRHALYHGTLEGHGGHIPLGTVLASSAEGATKKLRSIVLAALRHR
jgi:hypothetical protein